MSRRRLCTAAVLAAVLGWFGAAHAVMPGETMDDPVLEARARALYQELRCVVCQNQSIDASDAEIAADLRALVRDRLLAGDDDVAVRDYIVARYGTYVLLDPPVSPLTYGLWFGPPILLLAGATAIFVWRRRRAVPHDVVEEDRPLTEDERARLADLLQDGQEERHA